MLPPTDPTRAVRRYTPRAWRTRALLLATLCLVASAPAAAQRPSPLAGSFKAGPLALAFDSSGRYSVSLAGSLAVEGAYELRADTLVLHDRGGPRACPPEVAGTYTWSRAERTLKLAAAADDCTGRKGALEREWTATEGGGGAQALTGLTLVDGTGAAPRTGVTVLVENGRIRDVFPDGAKPLPAEGARIDLSGRWAIPGLIDAHVHVATDPTTDDARPRVLQRLHNALYGGVTTVRDMGGDARVLAGLARDARLGEIEAPDIVYGAIFAGPAFFSDPRVIASARGATAGEVPWARAVRENTDLRRAVAEAKGAGARALKLYAALPASALAPLVQEAHHQGLMVWSHATLFPARPSDAVAAGVDVLSHAALLSWEPTPVLPDWGSFVAMPCPAECRARHYAGVSATSGAVDALLRRMARQGTILDATLFVTFAGGPTAPAGEWSAKVTARARELGVRVAAGTDDLIDDTAAVPHIHDELVLLVQRAGFTPMQAIVAATSTAAAALGVQNDRGTIAPGMAADLVVLQRDPTADIRNTRAIVWVMKHGRRYPPAGA